MKDNQTDNTPMNDVTPTTITNQKIGKIENVMKKFLQQKFFASFFPDVKDRKQQKALQQMFILDMQFNVSNGEVTKTSADIVIQLPQILRILSQDDKSKIDSASAKLLLKIIEHCRFMKKLDKFDIDDKLQIVQYCQLQECQAGERIFQNQETEYFYFILKGNVGIFYPELKIIDEIGQDRVVSMTEAEVKDRLRKKVKLVKATPRSDTLDLFNDLINMQANVKENIWEHQLTKQFSNQPPEPFSPSDESPGVHIPQRPRFNFGSSLLDLTKISIGQCPILRDSKNKYQPLERHLVNLTKGCVFGEAMLLGDTSKIRFYNAIAMTTCKLLRISKSDFNYVLTLKDRKVFAEKMEFLRSVPEFKSLSLQRHKLQYLCSELEPINCIKGMVVIRQGDVKQFVYFVKTGSFQVSKSVPVKQKKDVIQNFATFIEDPLKEKRLLSVDQTKTKEHVLAVVSTGYSLGLEDQDNCYSSSAVCLSLKGSLFRIDREILLRTIASQQQVISAIDDWSAIKTKAYTKRVRTTNKTTNSVTRKLQHQQGTAYERLLSEINSYNKPQITLEPYVMQNAVLKRNIDFNRTHNRVSVTRCFTALTAELPVRLKSAQSKRPQRNLFKTLN